MYQSEGKARSNFFQVKDEQAFLAATKSWPELTVAREKANGYPYFSLVSTAENGLFSASLYDDDTGEWAEFDVAGEVCEHLAKGSVAVFQEVSADDTLYLYGWAEAVDYTGKSVRICLNDIYTLAAKELAVPRHKISNCLSTIDFDGA